MGVTESARYHYHDLKGMEAGCMMWSDLRPEYNVMAKDRSGRWGFQAMGLLDDGTYDISYTSRTINALIRAGYFEPGDSFDERGNHTTIRRTGKVGEPD